MKCILFAAVLLNSMARAQEGYFVHDHETWHRGFYQNLQRPDTGAPFSLARSIAAVPGSVL